MNDTPARTMDIMAIPFRAACTLCGNIMGIRIPVDMETGQQVYVHPDSDVCPLSGGHYAIYQNFKATEVEPIDLPPNILDAGGKSTRHLTKTNGGKPQ